VKDIKVSYYTLCFFRIRPEHSKQSKQSNYYNPFYFYLTFSYSYKSYFFFLIIKMQMNKAAAIAILAFTTSVVAYYPEAEYGSIYAREAYPEYDDFEIYAREAEPEAEPEWDIHPRDAYLEGYQAGLYARAVTNQPPAPQAKPAAPQAKKPLTPEQREGRVNNDERQAYAKKEKDQEAYKKQQAEIQSLQKLEKAEQQDIGVQKNRISNDDKRFNALRQQQLSGRDVYDWYF
jgi:hypothetical protein